MFGRIRDAARAFLHGPSAAEDDFRRMQQECRSLMHEMNDVLEKLSVWAAREAKRRSRATKSAVDLATAESPAPTGQAPAPLAEPFPNLADAGSRAAYKAAIRSRMMQRGPHLMETSEQ